MSNSEEFNAKKSKLLQTINITANCRFTAEQRLINRQKLYNFTVSYLGLFVIIASLIPNILKLEDYQSQILLACSILLSVFIIITSLIDNYENFMLKAEKLRDNANELLRIANHFDFVIEDADNVTVEQVLKQYHETLEKSYFSHDEVDYLTYLYRHPEKFVDNNLANLAKVILENPKEKRKLLFRIFYGTYKWMLPHLLVVFTVIAVIIVNIFLKSKFIEKII